uniref:C2H2-type domain-containing protein n=1 Tax=Iconisemion striatum TaxID=60296 RepID=A0A1A7YNN9_9TELE
MDEYAAAAIVEHGDDEDSRSHDGTLENRDHISPEDSGEGVGAFCCRDCGADFSEEAAYMEHHQHHQQNMYSDNQSDGLPVAEKDNETPYFCNLCSLSFNEMSELHLHMKNHDQIAPNPEFVHSGQKKQQTYECSECGKSYISLGYFLNHVRSHQTPSKSLFHNLEQLKKKPFQCESCGRNYSRASALDAHRRCHEEKLVKSKSKSSEDLLQTGESEVERKSSESHPENDLEKSFKCVCGKAFPTVSRLKSHQRFSHNTSCAQEKIRLKAKKNSSEFYCSECNKGFNSQIALFSHQRSHSNPTNSTQRFPCEECGKVFMTLTFYYRHKRTAHSDTTPAKSFHHQVCQVQKKAFECNNCGLKFSRASALHSHQLQHTTAFREGEKSDQTDPTLLLQESECKEMEHSGASLEVKVQSESFPATIVVEELDVNEADEDVEESYEPGDFNVQVISASDSESEDEASEDPKPDLELLCESDQDITDDTDSETNPESLRSKPEMDLKIVQIDMDQSGKQCSVVESEAGNKAAGGRHNCPDCYRWFTNPISLRVHRMWHGIRKRRQQAQAFKSVITCKDCGLRCTDLDAYATHLHQHALEEEEAQLGDGRRSAADMDTEEYLEEAMSGVAGGDDTSSLAQMQPPESTQDLAVVLKQKKSRQGHTCQVCGKSYMYLVSYQKHLKLHDKPSPTDEASDGRHSGNDLSLRTYECPDCGMSFIRRTRLISHLRVHRSRRVLESTVPRCNQCNKSFTTVKSWTDHVELHKQKRFWCLSCALGFFDEMGLDKHLQNHSLGQNGDDKGSIEPTSQKVRLKTYQCKYCPKIFRRVRSHTAHQMWHFRRRGAKKPLKISASDTNIQNFGSAQLTREAEEGDVGLKTEELQQVKEEPQLSEGESSFEDADCEKLEYSEESDCGEPVHCFKLSSSPGWADPCSESMRSSAGWELGKKAHREHKYREWECIECDMGFDKISELHLHYIKHATGEVPLPQHDME